MIAFVLLLGAPLPKTLFAVQQPFRTSTLGVRVDVLVSDGRKPVAGLSESDFELRDNGVAQSITIVDGSTLPINVVLALDVSASTTGERQADLIAGSEAMLDGLQPDDRVALTTFNHTVSPTVGLSSSIAAIRTALSRLSPSGRTSVIDASYVALTTSLAEPGRTVVIICTDGVDISSWLRPEDVVESAKRSNAVAYAVTAHDTRSTQFLEALTDTTGGDVLRVTSSATLRGAERFWKNSVTAT